VFGWRDHLAGALGPSTVSHHLASVPGFLAWVVGQGRGALPEGNPTLVLPPLEPRALTPARVRSLKGVVERFHRLKGRRAGDPEARHHVRARCETGR
jgi:hypothetical protein